MSYTEKAGNSLPFNKHQGGNAGNPLPHELPELEQLTQIQAHIHAAAKIVSPFTIHPLPQLSKDSGERFHNLSKELESELWEAYGDAQDLLSLFFIPCFTQDPNSL